MIGEEGAAWVGVVFDSRQNTRTLALANTAQRQAAGALQNTSARVGEERRGGSSSRPHGGAGDRRRGRESGGERERGVTSAEMRSEESDMSALGGACEMTSRGASPSLQGETERLWREREPVYGTRR